MEQLLTRDWAETFQLIWEIVLDPASKPMEAALIFGIVVVVLLMLMIAAILFVARHTEEDIEVGGGTIAPATVMQEGGAPAPMTAATLPPRRALPLGVTILGGLLFWWIATGLTTLAPSVCESCHPESIHALTSVADDPHESTSCVRCHEAGGYIGVMTTGVPGRVAHVVAGALESPATGAYGYVGSGSCNSCHGNDIAATTTSETKAVRVSHREPVEAGAECLDCHRVSDGVVGRQTTKMVPCLRCHDDVQVSADCAFCHTGDVSLAIAGRSEPTTATAGRLIPNPDCGGCHSQETCDSCHGIRLPHTQEFMQFAHAREGVQDLWFNGGRTCGKCHTEERRACTQCHKGRFLSHGTDFRRFHMQGSVSGLGCDNCHAEMSYRPRRDFCVDLCHQGETF